MSQNLKYFHREFAWMVRPPNTDLRIAAASTM